MSIQYWFLLLCCLKCYVFAIFLNSCLTQSLHKAHCSTVYLTQAFFFNSIPKNMTFILSYLCSISLHKASYCSHGPCRPPRPYRSGKPVSSPYFAAWRMDPYNCTHTKCVCKWRDQPISLLGLILVFLNRNSWLHRCWK